MSSDAAKAQVFVARLLANPALADQNPLQKEEQILTFLNANARQLYPTLSSASFFPGSDWPGIWSLLTQALTGITDAELLPLLKRTVYEKLDLSFISFLRQQNIAPDKVKDELFRFLQHSLKGFEARREFIGSLNAVLNKGDEKYLEQIYQRKEYAHFELTKVQRLKMSKEEVKNLIRTCLLMRPSVFGLSAAAPGSDRHAGLLPAQAASRVVETLQGRLTVMPEQVIQSTVNSTVSFLDNRFIEATARLTAVISSMYRSYRGNIKIDRGADTQDKSWISSARRNFKYFGYDIKLLDELYKIAAENGW
jgi:hypothetical protein